MGCNITLTMMLRLIIHFKLPNFTNIMCKKLLLSNVIIYFHQECHKWDDRGSQGSKVEVNEGTEQPGQQAASTGGGVGVEEGEESEVDAEGIGQLYECNECNEFHLELRL